MLYKNLLQWYPVDTDDHFDSRRPATLPQCSQDEMVSAKQVWPLPQLQNHGQYNDIPPTASTSELTVLITASKATSKNRCCSDRRFRQGLCSSIAAKWNIKKFWKEAKFIVTEERTQYNEHFSRMMYAGTDATKERTHATCWNNTSNSLLHM